MERRVVQPMPPDVQEALVESGVLPNYQERPFYQRNDYLAWIGRARRAETRERRIDQMIKELRRGGIYMKMDHPPSSR